MRIWLSVIIIALICLWLFVKLRKGLSLQLIIESIIILAVGLVLLDTIFFTILGSKNILSHFLPKVAGVYNNLVANEPPPIKPAALSDEVTEKTVAHQVVEIEEIGKKVGPLSSMAIKDRSPVSQIVDAEKFFSKERALLGNSVALSGQYAAVGAPSAPNSFGQSRGAVYIFKREQNQWIKKAKLIGNRPEIPRYASGNFGASVAISGDYAIVGSPLDDDKCSVTKKNFAEVVAKALPDSDLMHDKLFERGYLDLFNRITDKFQGLTDELKKDFPEYDENELNRACYALKISKKCSNAGSAFIFRRDGDVWVQQDVLHAFDAVKSNKFGALVAISGDYAMVGAIGQNDKYEGSISDLKVTEGNGGGVYFYKRNNTDWIQQDYKMFGKTESVAIDGDFAVLGGGGKAYVIKRNGSSWDIQAKLKAEDAAHRGEASVFFGCAVAISDDLVIVGNKWDDLGGRNKIRSGSAYIYKMQEDNWNQHAKITAGYYGDKFDEFGASVSISGGYVIVGAPGAEAKDHKGVGHTEHTQTMMAGAAYVFKREAESWTRQSRLVADDRSAQDKFGSAVSISDDFSIVGVPMDDETVENSGSVYIIGTTF